YLGPEGRRGTVLTHGFQDPHELDHLRNQAACAPAADAQVMSSAPSGFDWKSLDSRMDELEKNLTTFRQVIVELQETTSHLADQLRTIQKELGLSAPPTTP